MFKNIQIDSVIIFIAATYLNLDVKEISKYSDSLMGDRLRQVGFLTTDGIISLEKITKRLNENNIKINDVENGLMRFVTHYWISKEDIFKVVNILKEFLYK